MAEIRVEKRNRPVWPWILGILLAAVLIWVVADDNDRNDNQMATVERDSLDRNNLYNDPNYDRNGDQARNAAGNQDEAMAYVTFIEENGDRVTEEHTYSQQALTHLANALNSVANQGNAVNVDQAELDKLKQQANRLTNNPNSTEHSNILSDAFTTAANILENIQNRLYPDLDDEVKEVTDAAKGVKSNEVVTNQKDAVKNFFEKSATAIEAMTEDV